jgi:heme-degrading monooxygenase HmoA
MRMLPLCLLLALSLTACADDDDPKPAEQTTDPLAGCKSDVIEADFAPFGPPQGPVVDPQTQKITPPAGAVVATTYLALKPGDAVMGRFGGLVGAIQQDLGTRAGLLAISTSQSATCGVARTLTVWESEAAMMDFVMSESHIAAIQAVGEVSRGGSVTMTWSHTGGEVTWAGVAARLKDHDGPVY